MIISPATAYARPDPSSFDWIEIRSAVQVKMDRKVADFTQITYIENDQEPDPQFVSMQITAWIPDENLATIRRRYFYRLNFTGESPVAWTQFADHHLFTLYWAPLENLPEIIQLQNEWLVQLGKITDK